MSTPQEATELNPADWENAPVVIKTGGGQTGGETDPPLPLTMQCTIGVPNQLPNQNLGFRSTLLDDQWQSAKSDQHASITSVLIFQDGIEIKNIAADQPGLAVVQINYGEETLIVQEVALPDTDVYKMVSISSSRPFQVTDSLSPTEWADSKTQVPAEPPFVIVNQAGNGTPIRCTSTDVEIKIMVEWGD